MPSGKTTLNDIEMLDLARWLIDRYDRVRASVANRAATVVSADAILLAGMTFLADKVQSIASQYSTTERVVLLLSMGICFILIALSIVYAINAVAFVWKHSRQMVTPIDIPEILFFHARDTVTTFNKRGDFEERFKTTKKSQMLTYALGELLLITKSHHMRFQFLRNALRLILVAVIPFLLSIAILLFHMF